MSTAPLRERAEAQAQAIEERELQALSPDEIGRVLHELRVHQIELELQNEELRRAQVALEASQARYFDLYDLAPVGYLTVSEQGLILEANLRAALLLGPSRSALARQPLMHFILPADQDIYFLRRKRLFDTGEPQTCELRLAPRDADAAATWVRLEGVLAQDEAHGGRVCRVMLSDITERKEAERERERLLAQVQAQAQQIAQIMDAVPEGVLLLDVSNKVLLANPTGAHNLQALAGAEVGAQLTYLGDLPISELLAGGGPAPWREIRAGQRTFEVIARPVATDASATRQWVLVVVDVTEVRAIRAHVQQQDRLASIGQLAAGIAHDFNNILAVIALQTPLVAQAPGLGARERERLATISEQTAHATRLIQQILDFSRRAVLEQQPLDLGALLREQVELLQRTLPETIAVTLDCPPGVYTVRADPTRLQQLVMNLAVNARDAMPRGGALRLALARQETAPRPDLPDGPWVQLMVADSGTGLTPEAEAHLFEPFFTTKTPGKGTGLGLAQVYGIVKQHEGEIAVHSEAGRGVTFTIFLPAVAEAARPNAAPVAAAQAGGGETILIVEDNPALLTALDDILEMLGYDSLGASNGVEALDILAARGDAIALVLSDMVMPVMGGKELLAAIRARGLPTPVVILSGHPLENELADLEALGLGGWLLKPPSPEDLNRLIARALAAR